MKKVVKGLSVLAVSAIVCAGIGAMAGCSSTDGTYVGEYHYMSKYGQTYGMVVEVTVKDNIITAVKDLTNSTDERAKALQTYADKKYDGTMTEVAYHEWHEVSAGWETYYQDPANNWLWTETDENGNKIPSLVYGEVKIKPEETYIKSYAWTDATAANWTNHTSWLLQQYVGLSVADVLAMNIYTDYGYTVDATVDMDSKGEPYEKNFNADLNASGLLVTGATQGSGRLALAIQDALSK